MVVEVQNNKAIAGFKLTTVMQGLIQIEMLKTIEQMTGKSIGDLFDWVVGTSTGGVLALGMIYGKTMIIYIHYHV